MLTPRDVAAFRDDGYAVLRGAVAPAVVRAARGAINHDLGERGVPPEELPAFRSRSFCPQLREQPVLVDVFDRSAVPGALETLLGVGNLSPVTQAQVALRFPTPAPEDARWREHGHLDGVGSGMNGMEVGEFSRHFTCLAVVLLSDLPGPWNGNFTVWPGSHAAGETFFKKATPEVLKAGSPSYDLPRPPVQICGAPGDVVITHHQLWHGAAPNYGPDVRYAAIFRPAHVDVDQNGTATMTDIWREFPGVRALRGD